MEEILQELAKDGPLAVLFGIFLFRIDKVIRELVGEVKELRGDLVKVCRHEAEAKR